MMVNSQDTADLAQGWFEVREVEPWVFMIAEPLHVEQVKSYLILGRKRAILLDTGTGVGNIGQVVRELTDKPITVLNSHAHWDHIGGNRHFSDVMIHTAEVRDLAVGYSAERMASWLDEDSLTGPLPEGFDRDNAAIPPRAADGTIHGGEVFDIGDRLLEIVAAPGHSPGLIVVLDRPNKLLFGTDVVYQGALYAQLTGGNLTAYCGTLTYLAALASSLRAVYSSHGPAPMDPALILEMRDAFEQITSGRLPDVRASDIGVHDFGAFSVLTPAAST